MVSRAGINSACGIEALDRDACLGMHAHRIVYGHADFQGANKAEDETALE